MKNLNTLTNLEFMYNTVLNETKFSQLGKRFFDAVNAKLTTGLFIRWYKENSNVYVVSFHDQALRTDVNYHTEVVSFNAFDKTILLEKIQNHLSEIKNRIATIEEQTAKTDKIIAMEERAKKILHALYLETEQFVKECNVLLDNKALQIEISTEATNALYEFKTKTLPTIQKLFKIKLILIGVTTFDDGEIELTNREFIVYPSQQEETIEDYKKELQTSNNKVEVYVGAEKHYNITFQTINHKHLQYREGMSYYNTELHELITQNIEKRYTNYFNATNCKIQWEN